MRGLIVTFIAIILFGCATGYGFAQQRVDVQGVSYSQEDLRLFDEFVRRMQDKKPLPANELIIEAAKFFIHTPYVAGTLEGDSERLTVNFREFDCTTFVETVIALSLTLREPTPTFQLFCDRLRLIRYRNGEVNDYTDRLHYFTDWVYENQRAGLVKDVTKELGGHPFDLRLDFMSTHPQLYQQLKDNDHFVGVIRAKEVEVSALSPYCVIYPDEIQGIQIRDGDMVAFVTKVKGLDVTHVGFAERKGVEARLVHASSKAGMVVEDTGTLGEYTRRNGARGIMVIRLAIR
jgi:cell wall-associated NlpC family hydrolase